MSKQRAPVRRRDGQSEWLVPVLWQWSRILIVVLFLKSLQQLVKFSRARDVNKMRAIVVGYRSNSCDSSSAWTLSVPVSCNCCDFCFSIYSELFSQCFMFYFLFRHQIYLRCEHSPFVRRGECHSYICHSYIYLDLLWSYRSICTCMYLTLLVSICV